MVEAVASRLEAIAIRLEAMANRVEAIASRLQKLCVLSCFCEEIRTGRWHVAGSERMRTCGRAGYLIPPSATLNLVSITTLGDVSAFNCFMSAGEGIRERTWFAQSRCPRVHLTYCAGFFGRRQVVST